VSERDPIERDPDRVDSTETEADTQGTDRDPNDPGED
jgi:hypothetical protein